MCDCILVNDIVSVNFNGSRFTLYKEAKVLYVPEMPCDAWILKDLETGTVSYVSEPCTITKLRSAEENEG